MVEHFVISDDALACRASFEFREFFREPFDVLGFEFGTFCGSNENERRSKEDGDGDEKDDGEFGHARRIRPLSEMSRGSRGFS